MVWETTSNTRKTVLWDNHTGHLLVVGNRTILYSWCVIDYLAFDLVLLWCPLWWIHATRIITGTKRHEHMSPALRELNWLPIHLAVQYRDTVVAFKCVKSLAPPYLCKKFRRRSDVHSLATRNSNLLNIPSLKSASGQRSFHYRATKLWNALPDDMKDLQLDPFKQKLQSLLWEDFKF